MSKKRPFVLSIAGFDPSAGAGVLADIKTFESFKTYGLSVISANTIQHDEEFKKCNWISEETIHSQLELLCERFDFGVVKVGIIENSKILCRLFNVLLNYNKVVKIIYDPVLKSSTDFTFTDIDDKEFFFNQLKKVELVTPNSEEIKYLMDDSDPHSAAIKLSEYCSVLLKGGHIAEKTGHDYLYNKGALVKVFMPSKIADFSKHGTGCILSSAIAANLALGLSLSEAISLSKSYISKILFSNDFRLGYHKI